MGSTDSGNFKKTAANSQMVYGAGETDPQQVPTEILGSEKMVASGEHTHSATMMDNGKHNHGRRTNNDKYGNNTNTNSTVDPINVVPNYMSLVYIRKL